MKIDYKNVDVFSYYPTVPLVSCVSADFVLNAGIAKQFDIKLGTQDDLRSTYSDYKQIYDDAKFDGDCLSSNSNKVFNLIIKSSYIEKPTLHSLEQALRILHRMIDEQGIKEVAMPCICCGSEMLKWSQVYALLSEEFKNSSLHIIVCYLDINIIKG